MRDVAVAQDFDRFPEAFDDPYRYHVLRGYLRTFRKNVQAVQINDGIFGAEDIVETALVRQALDQRILASLEKRMNAAA